MADNQQVGNPGQGNQAKAQNIQWQNAPNAAQAGASVLMGTPITGGGDYSGYTPLYDAQTGGFAGWQDPKGQNFQGYNGMYGNYNVQTGQMYAPPTYPPPQQPQQQQQGPSLADMWKAYMSQGAQQAPAQQPAAAATIAPITPYQGQQLGTATPYATIPQAQSSFAPPPPPAPGQQQQQPGYAGGGVVRGYQSGGLVQNQQNQGYTLGGGQGVANPLYAMSAIGAMGAPMIINPTPQAPTPGNYPPGNQYGGGVYTGSQQPTVYGTQTPTPPSQAIQGIVTLPNGQQLNQEEMAHYMQANPQDQQAIAAALGASPAQIQQAASANWAQQAQAAQQQGIFNAPIQNVTSNTGVPQGAQTAQYGMYRAAPMPTGTSVANLQPTPVANAALARPFGQSGQPYAFAPGAGMTPLPPSTAPPMMAGGGMGMMWGQPGMRPPAAPGGAPGGVGNYAAGGVGIQPQFMAAHTDALANAGMALYRHYGGDPSTATPEDIANFQNQFTAHATAMINAGAGGAAGGAATALGTGAPAAGAPPAKKMSTGGPVPGRGNTDSVPAMLTPGEYVLNRQQVAQLFGGRNPISMQEGGYVPDDYASIGGSGYGSPMSIESPMGQAPSMSGAFGDAGGGPLSQKQGNAIQGVISGLTKAAQTYADSFKEWKPIAQAFGGPSAAPKEPVTQFRQERVS